MGPPLWADVFTLKMVNTAVQYPSTLRDLSRLGAGSRSNFRPDPHCCTFTGFGASGRLRKAAVCEEYLVRKSLYARRRETCTIMPARKMSRLLPPAARSVPRSLPAQSHRHISMMPQPRGPARALLARSAVHACKCQWLSSGANSDLGTAEQDALPAGGAELGQTKGKMKKLRSLAADLELDTAGSKQSLIDRILAHRGDQLHDDGPAFRRGPVGSVADAGAPGSSAVHSGTATDESPEAIQAREQLALSYHKLIHTLVSKGNQAAAAAAAARARDAGVDEGILAAALEMEEMDGTPGPTGPVSTEPAVGAASGVQLAADAPDESEDVVDAAPLSMEELLPQCKEAGLLTSGLSREELDRRLRHHRLADGDLYSRDDLSSYTGVALREMCKERALPQSGACLRHTARLFALPTTFR